VARACLHCDEPLPIWRRSDARYCDGGWPGCGKPCEGGRGAQCASDDRAVHCRGAVRLPWRHGRGGRARGHEEVALGLTSSPGQTTGRGRRRALTLAPFAVVTDCAIVAARLGGRGADRTGLGLRSQSVSAGGAGGHEISPDDPYQSAQRGGRRGRARAKAARVAKLDLGALSLRVDDGDPRPGRDERFDVTAPLRGGAVRLRPAQPLPDQDEGRLWSARAAPPNLSAMRCTCTDPRQLEAHHLVPLREGGTNDPANGVAVCRGQPRMVESQARRCRTSSTSVRKSAASLARLRQLGRRRWGAGGREGMTGDRKVAGLPLRGSWLCDPVSRRVCLRR
jgi:hypothetical protein